MDYMLLMIFGLVIVSAIAFRVFLPDYFSRRASTRSQLRVQEVGGYAGAMVFALMALSGEPTGWLVAAVMFASGAWASAKRAEEA